MLERGCGSLSGPQRHSPQRIAGFTGEERGERRGEREEGEWTEKREKNREESAQ